MDLKNNGFVALILNLYTRDRRTFLRSVKIVGTVAFIYQPGFLYQTVKRAIGVMLYKRAVDGEQ